MKKMLFILSCAAVVWTSGCQCHDLAISESKGICIIRDRGQSLLEYNYGATEYKPYVIKLYTPSGVNVVRDQVGDHKHHHGLMLAWMVNGVNFWEETAESGFEAAAELQAKVQVGLLGNLSIISHCNNWLAVDKTTILLQENRTLQTSFDLGSGVILTTWTSVFSVPAGQASATLSGSHYNGLGMRFLKSMDNNGDFINPIGQAGTIFRGEERLTEAPWCAYLSQAEGKAVTVAMFDHPANPRRATWFTMKTPFAYLSATMRLHEKPIELKSGQSLTLRYGIALWDGHKSPAEIKELYEKWVRASKRSKK